MLSKSRRPQWSKPPGLPCRRSRRQSNTIPNGTEVEPHPPPRLAAWHAGLRAPPQPAEPCRGGPACPPILIHLRALPCSRKAAAPSGASRQACHAGGHAGRATQSRTVREFERHPPPRLAAWHAGLRAPPQPAAPCRGGPACPPLFYSPISVFSVVCFSPCPPCSLWFLSVSSVVCAVVPCPPHPQSQPSPNLFSFPFQPLPNSPFLLLLLPLVC
jgi:hypothetical protein